MKKAALTAALLGAVALAAVTIAQNTSKPIIVGSSQPVSLASGKISDGNSIWVQLQIYDRLMEFKPGTADVTQGLQFEIDCTIGEHTGGLYGDGRGWLVWPAPENETVVRQDDWNEYLLKVEGNRYISRLNGVLMVDFTDPKPKSFDGGISLQLHSGGSGNMRFKDILIRDLTKR